MLKTLIGRGAYRRKVPATAPRTIANGPAINDSLTVAHAPSSRYGKLARMTFTTIGAGQIDRMRSSNKRNTPETIKVIARYARPATAYISNERYVAATMSTTT